MLKTIDDIDFHEMLNTIDNMDSSDTDILSDNETTYLGKKYKIL